MANSYLDYQGRELRINDQILTIIVMLAADEIRHEVRSDPDLRKLVEAWEAEVTTAPPGLISITLSGYCETTHGAQILWSLLDQIGKKISSFGARIPATVLCELSKSHDVVFVDVDSEIVIGALDRWKALLDVTGGSRVGESVN